MRHQLELVRQTIRVGVAKRGLAAGFRCAAWCEALAVRIEVAIGATQARTDFGLAWAVTGPERFLEPLPEAVPSQSRPFSQSLAMSPTGPDCASIGVPYAYQRRPARLLMIPSLSRLVVVSAMTLMPVRRAAGSPVRIAAEEHVPLVGSRFHRVHTMRGVASWLQNRVDEQPLAGGPRVAGDAAAENVDNPTRVVHDCAPVCR